MTANEQLAEWRKQLNESLLRKEIVSSELEQLNLTIRALRNAVEGAQVGVQAVSEQLEERRAAAAADAAPVAEEAPPPAA